MSTFGITPIDAKIDWDALTRYAIEVKDRSHVPGGAPRTGAAGLVDDGRVVLGCFVEHPTSALSLCAESGVVSALHGTGGGKLVALVVVDESGQPTMPCENCTYRLSEHGAPEVLSPG
ncbi:MAG: cytidine deaminase [Aeromicrobium sp.]|nr:MAG: cytidine deaminase [Aeromicrobium sp.]